MNDDLKTLVRDCVAAVPEIDDRTLQAARGRFERDHLGHTGRGNEVSPDRARPRHWLHRPLLLGFVAVALLATVLVVTVGGARRGPVTTGTSPHSHTSTTAPAPVVRPPALMSGALITAPPGVHELIPGTVVPLRDLGAVSFATSEVGYALGNLSGSTYPLQSVDGGRIWRIDGPALSLPSADAPLSVEEITAVGPQTAYAYGGPGAGSAIDVTTDGGRKWWGTLLGQALVAASGPATDLWVLAIGAADPSSSTAPPPVWLYDSSDGGRSWHYRSTLAGVAGWEADLVRPSPLTAYALVKSFRNTDPQSAGIVETSDGGATWTKRADPCNAIFSGGAMNWTERLGAASRQSLWLFCASEPGTGMQAKLVERSNNGGNTWTLVASNAPGEHVPPNDIPLIGELPDSGTTGSLAVTSSLGVWLILGGNNVLLNTADGGSTWFQAAPPTVEAQFPRQFSLVSGSVIVLTENGLWALRSGHWMLIAGSSKAY